MFGLDCEMVQTTEGKEVGRVCIVGSDCSVLIDMLVRPKNPVSDYLTEFSGLTKEILDKATFSLDNLHSKLRKVLPPGAILVGHSLEHDLHALHLVHSRCIDTSVLYPHPRRGRCHSLKWLAQQYLKKTLERAGGHNPCEDAQMAMLLALKKIRNGPDFASPMMQLAPLGKCMQALQRLPQQNDGAEEKALYHGMTERKMAEISRSEQQTTECLFLADSIEHTCSFALEVCENRTKILSNCGPNVSLRLALCTI